MVIIIIKEHTGGVTELLELYNEKLVTCSYDRSFIIYF